MNGKDFLEFAKLICDSSDEAARRSSTSRAYYALFHLVRDIAEAVGTSFDKKEVHRKLILYLKSSSKRDVVNIGRRMDTLHKDRKKADYELSSPFNNSICKSAFNRAEIAWNDLSKIATDNSNNIL